MKLIGHWIRSHEGPVNSVTGLVMAIGAIIAALMAIKAFNAQVNQSRVALWRSLCEEWDHKLLKARVACVKARIQAPRAELVERYPRVMNFFESLAYLVRRKEIPEELAMHTFAYYFFGYFRWTLRYTKVDHEKDKKTWEDVFWLYVRWQKIDLTNEQFSEFMGSEEHLLD